MHAGKVEVMSLLLFLSESEHVSDFELMGVCCRDDGSCIGTKKVDHNYLLKSWSETNEQRL